MTRLALALSVGIAALLPCAAGAQTAPAAEARALFDRAREAIDTGHFARARDLLRRSLAIEPNVGSAFNLAIAQRGTGEVGAAIETFEALLDDRYGPLTAQQRAEITALVERARSDVAELRVEVTGAERIEVRVDGALVATASEGETVRTRVDPGEHVVTASAPRRTSYEERVVVPRGGHATTRAELGSTLPGTLVVETPTPEAIVEILGVVRGAGSVRRELPPGEYRVVVSDRTGRRETAARVESGELVRLSLAGPSAGSPVYESPWLWSGIALALAAGAVGIVVPLTVTQEEAPVTDSVYGVVVTLTMP